MTLIQSIYSREKIISVLKLLLRCFLLIFTISLIAIESLVSFESIPLRVLLLSSGNTESPWTMTVEKGFREELKKNSDSLSLYVEYFDAPRFGYEETAELTRANLISKFKKNQIDYFVSLGIPASRFSKSNPEILLNAKKIYVQSGITKKVRNDTEVYIDAATDYIHFIEEVVRLSQPRKLYIIGDAKTSRSAIRLTNLSNFLIERNIDFVLLKDLPLEGLKKVVSSLTPLDSIIFLPIDRNLRNKKLVPSEVVERISLVATAPIFAMDEFMVGSGPVGGFLVSNEKLGRIAASAVLNIQRGGFFESSQRDIFGYYYDWRQIERWGYEKRIHPEGEIRFRKHSLLIQYKTEIITSSVILLLLTFTTIALFITNRKLKGVTLNLKQERTKLEKRTEDYKKSKEEAEQANKAKSQFLANMSHELRTPIHHIGSYAYIGIKQFNSKKERVLECFEKVISANNRMLVLIDNLFDLSRLEAGKMEYTFEENDVFQMVNENITKFSQQLEENELSIVMDQPTVSSKIVCDRTKINQVIQNIISNSIKFTQKNKNIFVLLDRKNSSLSVSIKDEGPGIPEAELEFIFDGFSQSSRTKTGAGGTGLGLAICKEIIEAHNGKIQAGNNPEGGATLSFVLPYEQEAT